METPVLFASMVEKNHDFQSSLSPISSLFHDVFRKNYRFFLAYSTAFWKIFNPFTGGSNPRVQWGWAYFVR